MTPNVFGLIEKKNSPPTKDCFEEFLEWITPNAATEPMENQTTASSELDEWVKSVVEEIINGIECQQNPFDEARVESKPNPYQHWPGDKREPYTKMLSIN